ncbi:unnamed protein product [Orchesella dallaii]|uniref:Transposable element P transposase-like RNase H domain-containing protein n=1 Tax=Orchesella dallaii TaxID=48710 RepID=A0ABP1QKC4_9HEXA
MEQLWHEMRMVFQILSDELNYERERNKLLENEMTKLLATQGYLKQNIKNLQTKSKECRRQKLYWKKRHTKRWEQLTELRKRPAVTPISETDGRILAAVGQIFSPSQLQALASKKKRTKWTSDDIAQAISIRSKGSGCYSYMRALGHPFPDKSTICRWTGKLPFVPGLQEEILTMLMHQFLCVPLTSKLAGLCFDETNVDSKLQYDPSLDCILGYCSGMLVVLLRALADDWKQPVYYTFEKNISSEILLSV